MTPYKPSLVYFNKLNGETYKKSSKQLIWKTKFGYLNDKNVIMKNNEKKIENNFLKNYEKY